MFCYGGGVCMGLSVGGCVCVHFSCNGMRVRVLVVGVCVFFVEVVCVFLLR